MPRTRIEVRLTADPECPECEGTGVCVRPSLVVKSIRLANVMQVKLCFCIRPAESDGKLGAEEETD
jgi:hypothetical protein